MIPQRKEKELVSADEFIDRVTKRLASIDDSLPESERRQLVERVILQSTVLFIAVNGGDKQDLLHILRSHPSFSVHELG